MLGEGDEIKNEILDQKRRKKRKNWTTDEFAVLTSLATEKASILDKRYDNALSKQQKDAIWANISQQVSLASKIPRSPRACKRRWHSQKNKATTNVKKWIAESRKTGF